jgi:hypothetical protein
MAPSNRSGLSLRGVPWSWAYFGGKAGAEVERDDGLIEAPFPLDQGRVDASFTHHLDVFRYFTMTTEAAGKIGLPSAPPARPGPASAGLGMGPRRLHRFESCRTLRTSGSLLVL